MPFSKRSGNNNSSEILSEKLLRCDENYPNIWDGAPRSALVADLVQGEHSRRHQAFSPTHPDTAEGLKIPPYSMSPLEHRFLAADSSLRLSNLQGPWGLHSVLPTPPKHLQHPQEASPAGSLTGGLRMVQKIPSAWRGQLNRI